MRRSHLIVSLAFAVIALASPASAEWFADAYLGAAITHKADVTFEAFDAEFSRNGEFTSSAVHGLRLGKWFDQRSWLGVAVDASYFRASADVQVIPLTGLLMVRYGFFPDDEFKEGRLHAYAGLGGGLFISNVDGFVGRVEASDVSVDFGLDTRLGASYRLERNWALFFEYRFTHVSPSYDARPVGVRSTIDTTLNTSHFLLGVSYRF
jgi:opacity protein-like surface antigen